MTRLDPTVRCAIAMTPTRAADVCDPATRELINTSFDAVWGSEKLDLAEVTDLAAGAEVLITSWGTPPLPADLFGPGGPTIVGHAAGTVKKLLPAEVVGQQVQAFSAAGRIAWSVGELCLATCLTMLRELPALDADMRAGHWRTSGARGQELRGRRVALIGASATARAFRELLVPFRAEVVVHDPYLTEEKAAALDVTPVSLEDAMDAEIVSLHVPNLPATEGMITAELLARMPDGALLINSARAASINAQALTTELLSGRIRAAVDVFDPEPAELSVELRSAPNVLLTPHIAGDSVQGHLALVRYVLDDIIAFRRDGTHGPSWVDPAVWGIAA